MQKEVFEHIKKELTVILIMFVIILIATKIIFKSENFFIVLRTVVAIFWLIFIPGYAITFHWREKLKLYERFIIGIAISTALIGLLSYYLGLIGLHIKFHIIVLPLVFRYAAGASAQIPPGRKASGKKEGEKAHGTAAERA